MDTEKQKMNEEDEKLDESKLAQELFDKEPPAKKVFEKKKDNSFLWNLFALFMILVIFACVYFAISYLFGG